MMAQVWYHANCYDGFCAAWVANKYLTDAVFTPVNYGADPPKYNPGDRIFILDFSYPRDVMEELIEWAYVTCLDHHKSAQEALDGLQGCTFDMSKSGGRLAWDYFSGSKHVPWLVQYTEDRDLWKWALPSSRTVNAGLRTYPFDFVVWEELTFSACLKAGQVLERYLDKLVAGAIEHAVLWTVDDIQLMGVNCTQGDIISDVAGALATSNRPGMTWFRRSDGKYVYSLRGPGSMEIAKRFGGGGHPLAAGFELSTGPVK